MDFNGVHMNTDITFRNGYYLAREIFANYDTDPFTYVADHIAENGKKELIEAHDYYYFKYVVGYVVKYGYDVVNAFVLDLANDRKEKMNDSDNG